MNVNFFATLRQITGSKVVEFIVTEGTTIGQLLKQIVERFPALREELLDEEGNLYQNVHMFVNGRDVAHLNEKMDTVITPEDNVSIFPAVGGG